MPSRRTSEYSRPSTPCAERGDPQRSAPCRARARRGEPALARRDRRRHRRLPDAGVRVHDDVAGLRDPPGCVEPRLGLGGIVGESPVPALLGRHSLPLGVEGAQATSDVAAALHAARAEVIARRRPFECGGVEQGGERDVSGFVHAEERAAHREIAPEVYRPRQSGVVLQDVEQRLDGQVPLGDERLHDGRGGEVDAARLAPLTLRDLIERGDQRIDAFLRAQACEGGWIERWVRLGQPALLVGDEEPDVVQELEVRVGTLRTRLRHGAAAGPALGLGKATQTRQRARALEGEIVVASHVCGDGQS